jgi:hypothetical protein
VENEDSWRDDEDVSKNVIFEIHATQISSKWMGAGLLPDGEPQAIFGIGEWESLPLSLLSIQQPLQKYVFHAWLTPIVWKTT